MKISRRIERTTLSRQAYVALRSAMLKRQLPSGIKLIVRLLAEELHLSPTPIKEALAALEREGLVEAVPHRGYFIPQISTADVKEIYALREVVEGLAARLATEGGDRNVAGRLEQLLAKQRAAGREGDFERYGDLDLNFHRTLWEASGNRRLLRVAEAFAGQVRLLTSTSALLPGRLHASLQEHTRLVAAVSANDPESAEAIMREHVRLAGIALKDYLQAQGTVRTHEHPSRTGHPRRVISSRWRR